MRGSSMSPTVLGRWNRCSFPTSSLPLPATWGTICSRQWSYKCEKVGKVQVLVVHKCLTKKARQATTESYKQRGEVWEYQLWSRFLLWPIDWKLRVQSNVIFLSCTNESTVACTIMYNVTQKELVVLSQFCSELSVFIFNCILVLV